MEEEGTPWRARCQSANREARVPSSLQWSRHAKAPPWAVFCPISDRLSLDGLHLLASMEICLAGLLYGFQVQTVFRKKSYSCLEVTNLSPLCGQTCTFVSEPPCPDPIGWQKINLWSLDAPPLSEVVLSSVGCTLHQAFGWVGRDRGHVSSVLLAQAGVC